MTQSTMTKPATSSTYNPYSDMDADKKKSDTATADSVSAEPVYKLVIDENVVEKTPPWPLRRSTASST